jgi:uncharacterized glyoxalase superfamily protein PhnB
MIANRSVPNSTVIPELAYADVGGAAAWLETAFGFTVRVRIANHRIQMNVGDGAIVLTERRGGEDDGVDVAHSVMVRVEDAQAHHDRAKAAGARILREPTDFFYGERQYNVQDVGGHFWTFTQSIKDVAPEEWGGESGQL